MDMHGATCRSRTSCIYVCVYRWVAKRVSHCWHSAVAGRALGCMKGIDSEGQRGRRYRDDDLPDYEADAYGDVVHGCTLYGSLEDGLIAKLSL